MEATEADPGNCYVQIQRVCGGVIIIIVCMDLHTWQGAFIWSLLVQGRVERERLLPHSVCSREQWFKELPGPRISLMVVDDVGADPGFEPGHLASLNPGPCSPSCSWEPELVELGSSGICPHCGDQVPSGGGW